MEEITMEKLLNDFNEVIKSFNKLVRNNDVKGVKKALQEVEKIVKEGTNIELDNPNFPDSDHVLHELLKKLKGHVKVDKVTDPKQVEEIIEIIEKLEIRIKIIEEQKLTISKKRTNKLSDEDLDKEIAEREGQTGTQASSDYLAELDEKIHNLERAVISKDTQMETAETEEKQKQFGTERNVLYAQLQEARKLRENAEKGQEIPKSGTITSEVITEETIFEQIRIYEETIKEIKTIESKKEKTTEEETYVENLETITALKIDRTTRYITKELKKAQAEKDKLLEEGITDEEYNAYISELDEKIHNLERAVISKDTQMENAATEEEQKRIGTERNVLYAQLQEARRLRKQVGNDRNVVLQRKIAELEEKIAGYLEGKDVIAKYRRSITSIVTARYTKIKKTIVKNKGKAGIDPDIEAGEIDVDAEVARIGDKIFKTAEIRKELSSRNISREEFLEYYRAGVDATTKNIEELDKKLEELEKLGKAVFIDKEAEEAGNEEKVNLAKIIREERVEGGDKEKLVAACNKVRKNLIDNGVQNSALDNEVTEENVDSFLEYLGEFAHYMDDETHRLSVERFDQEESKQIFEKEIRIIEKEQATIESVENEEILKDSEDEKALRRAQISAFLHPEENPELIKEWKERFERFYSHKITQTMPYAKDGEIQDIRYETIEDYPEMEEDAYFLNLEDYKKYLETTTKYRNSGNDREILDPEAQQALIEMEEKSEKETGKKYSLEETIQEMEHYVESFHGHTNQYRTKYEIYKTAGSTLKSMVPVKDLSPAKKALTIGENVFRFFGIRLPKFSRVDENGKTVPSIGGGIGTLAVDALVVGGIAAAAVAGPITLASVGVAYAAKGIVTAGNLIAAGVTKRRHAYEIENNIPTAGISKDDAEVMRKDYYRAVEGKGRFSSWLKAKNDRFFRRGRAEETLEKIEQKRFEESDSAIDIRDEIALEQEQENLERARKNQEARQKNYETIARSDVTYNDIVRDPDSLDSAQAQERIAQNAALRMRGRNGRTVNPNSTQELTSQYVKNNPDLIETEDLEDVVTEGGTVATTAITEEERYTARQQKVDRRNKVITGLLTIAGKLGIDAINGGFMEKIEKIREEVVPGFKEVMAKKKVGEKIKSDSLDKLEVSDQGMDNWYLKEQQTRFTDDITSRGLSSNVNDPSAAAINYIGSDGKEYVASIAQKGLGYTTKHVHSLVNADISSMSPTELVECIAQKDPNFYNQLINKMGLAGKPFEEVAIELVKGGHLSLQGKAMEGWRKVLESNIEDVVDFVPKKIPYNVLVSVPYTEEKFNPLLVLLSGLKGAGLGAAIGVVDQLHEAAHQTKRKRPGVFEQNTEDLVPDNPLVAWARKGISEARRKIRERQESRSENEEQHENDEEK